MNAGRILAERAAEPANHDSRRLMSLQDLYALPTHSQSIADYWRILQKRRLTIFVSMTVVVIAAGLISLRMTPIYDAAARISIQQQSSNGLNLKDNESSQSFGNPQQNIDTEIKILQSETLAQAVIKRLGLDRRPEFAGKAQAKTSGGIAVSESSLQERSRQDVLIRRFSQNLKVQQVPATSLIEIKYSSTDSALATEIANTVATTFIEQNIKARYDSTMQAADWLSKQLADLQIKVETSQTKLVNYEKENGIVGTDDKQNLTVDKLDELNKELTQAQADRIQKESLFQIAKNSDADSVSAVFTQDPILAALRQQQTQLETQDALLSTQFGPFYPKVLEVKNQLDQIKRAYKDELQKSVERLQNDYQTALKREEMLQAALTKQTDAANQLNQNAIQYKALKQEADSNRQLYDGLLLKLKEASLAAGLESSNIRVVDQARMPLHPARPNIPLNMEFAVLIGLVGGVAIAFTLEALDTTVRTPEQAESISGLPILGLIPLQSSLNTGVAQISKVGLLKATSRGNIRPEPLISHLEPHSEIAEAYRALRTSVLLSSVSHPPRTILITSSVPQDGKTMTSINTSIVLAQQGKRVLLVDADMRRPSIHKIFHLGGQVGLSNILTGGAKIDDVIQATMQPNLFVVPAGPVPPHPSELLGSSLMQELLKIWRDDFDHVVIDSPPVVSVTDAVLLSVQVDAVMLIIRSGQTTNALVRRSRDLLLSVNANILGMVVNAADLSSPDYYNYYYGSKYRYYTQKKNAETKPSDSFSAFNGSTQDDSKDVAGKTS